MNSLKSYELPARKLGEEIANSITHGIGWLLAIVGLVVLVVEAGVTARESVEKSVVR